MGIVCFIEAGLGMAQLGRARQGMAILKQTGQLMVVPFVLVWCDIFDKVFQSFV